MLPFWKTSGGSTFSSLLSSVKMSLPLTSSKLSTCTEEVSDSDLLMTSPRIGKSFCSRIKASPPQLTMADLAIYDVLETLSQNMFLEPILIVGDLLMAVCLR